MTDIDPTGLNPDASELKSPAVHTAYNHHDAYDNPLRLDYHGGGIWSFVAPTGRSFISSGPLIALADIALEQAGVEPRASLSAPEPDDKRIAIITGGQEFTAAQWEAVRGYMGARLDDAGVELRRVEAERDAALADRDRFARRGETAASIREALQERIDGLQGVIERLSRERNDARDVAPQCAGGCDNFSGPVEGCELHGESREVLVRQRDEARAAVPDLPAVSRIDDTTLKVGSERWYARRGDPSHGYRATGLTRIAVAEFLDREMAERAADTHTTEAVEALAAILCEADDTNEYSFDGAGIHLRCTYRDMARAALAYRSTIDTKD